MLPLKKHLQNLNRVKNTSDSRLKYLRLDKNENIIPFPTGLMAKLRGTLSADFISAYPEVDTLYQDIAQFEKCGKDNVYITSGSDGAIKAVFEAFVSSGDTVLLISPSYAMFYVYAKMFEANLSEVFYQQDLSLPVEKILSAINTQKPKLVCIANPNSPTGTVISPSDLETIIKAAYDIQSVVLIDEAYYLFYEHTCAKLIQKFPQLIVTRTFSKAFGLASLRLGFAIAGKEMIQALHKTRPMYETNAFAVKFAQIVLKHPKVIKSNILKIKSAKRYLESELKKMGLLPFKSYANFVLIDLGSKEKALNVARSLKKRKFLVKDGFNFPPLDRCIRVNIGDKTQMTNFIKALRSVLRID